jgi:cardiolipin synthase A/B
MRHNISTYGLVSRTLRDDDLSFGGARRRAFEAGNPRVFNGGQVAFAEIVSRIHQTEKRMEMRAFLWRDDEVGNQLGEAILAAAERGVQVSIQKDRIAAVYEYTGGNKQSFFHKRINPTQGLQAWFLGTVYKAPGSFKQRRNPLAEAILSHPNITVQHKRKRFDHSKLFVFDDRWITLGSMGIGDNHRDEWIDVMVEVEGGEHVARLQQRLAGDDEFDPSRYLDFLVHTRGAHRPRSCPMLAHRLALIDAATTSLTVEMAYLGDPRFTAALLRAIRRGVDVTLITAARADVLGNLNLATCDTLMRRTGAPQNLTIVLLPRMVHTKMVVVDRRICDIGSANFTPLSHGVYEEINLYADDANFAAALEQVAETHCAEGRVVERRVGYRRLYSQVERAIVAYQSRKGAKGVGGKGAKGAKGV